MDDQNKNIESDTLESSLESNNHPNSIVGATAPEVVNSPLSQVKEKRKFNFISKFINKSSIYLPIFIVLFLLVGGLILYSFNKQKTSSNNNTTPGNAKQQNLSIANLNKIASSSEQVGSANQVLNVQSSSIFNGQVLIRNGLQVAGSLQVGGNITLAGIDVTGNSVFQQMQINKNLLVGGNTNVQGSLNVQNGLTVNGGASFTGAISAPQITTNSLQLNGPMTFNNHIIISGSIPSISSQTANGGGGTATLNGSDTAGIVTINSGSSTSAGCLAIINFSSSFTHTPIVNLTPDSASASSLQYYVNQSTSNFQICSNNSPTAGQSYKFNYFIVD